MEDFREIVDFVRTFIARKNSSLSLHLLIGRQVSTRYMGINVGRGEDKKNFAVEVLKIKITGPNRSHFSILDLPGIFMYDHNVRECEMVGVRDMVAQYMARPEHVVM